MKTTAAVLFELGRPLELVDLEVPALKPGQVVVDMAYSGVCHTQVLECRGHRGEDRFLPHCLGHEGSGVVRDVATGVSKVRPGDRVILSWIKASGADVPSTVYRCGGRNVNAGAITTFSRQTIVSENRLTKLPGEFPLSHAVLMGCAIPTGVGAVLNAAQPRPGQSLAVFGVGGVGSCAVAGAAVSGCLPLIAVDVQDMKLQTARELGATHTINAASADVVAEILKICPGGLDFAVEVSGRPAVMQQALLAVRPRGGTAVIVGNAPHGQKLELDPWQFNLGKRLLGTWGGESDPDRDNPRYCRLLASGKLNLTPILSAPYGLEQINAALDDLERGVVGRPLVLLNEHLN